MMSELSGHCEDDSCVNESKEYPVRVFPCLYHCKKMLCIKHLSEHDKYIEKQINFRKQLQFLWDKYISIFDEDKIKKEYLSLKIKLENHQQLTEKIKSLLIVNYSHDSFENDQNFEYAIEAIQQAIQHENPSHPNIDEMGSQIGFTINNEEENQLTTDYASLSSSITSNEGTETVESLPSMLNVNGNSPHIEQEDEPDVFQNSMNVENTNNRTLKIENNENVYNNSSFAKRRTNASKLCGFCPLTQDGIYGINSNLHGIRLCPIKNTENQRPCRLHSHFLRFHHLTPLASLALVRAISSGHDPTTTKLFKDYQIILNIDELRTVSCPFSKPLRNYPLLAIEKLPCHTIRQVRQLKSHLTRVHKLTNYAATIIVKSVKNDVEIDTIEFPRWINIIENDSST